MRLKQGQLWHCMNAACAAEIRVIRDAGLAEGSNPRCSCGSIMKMPYSKPRLRTYGEGEKPEYPVRELSGVWR